MSDSDLSDTFSVHSPDERQFSSIKFNEIVTLMNELVDNVVSVVEMPRTTARILLSHVKWDVIEVLDRVTSDDCEKFFAAAHVRNPFEEEPTQSLQNESDKCKICYTDIPPSKSIGLSCGHYYCPDCWSNYLTNQIMELGNAESLSCPQYKCETIVDDGTILKVLTDDVVVRRFLQLLTDSFVQFTHNLRWCPSPQCSLAIKAERFLDNRQNCTCECGTSFCFNCGESPHDPIPCNLMEEWNKDDNDETIKYFFTNTNECPNCKVVIEKNDGCDHMVCCKCKHEFCWICLKPWESHYRATCKKKEWDYDRNRWLLYFARYANHRQYLESEKSPVTNVEHMMECMQITNNKTWSDVQFVRKASEILRECRRQLMLTYIFTYFVKSNNQKKIFESIQEDLESATEKLAQDLSKRYADNLDLDEEAVKNHSNYCEIRLNKMQCYIYEGFENNWWTFDSS